MRRDADARDSLVCTAPRCRAEVAAGQGIQWAEAETGTRHRYCYECWIERCREEEEEPCE